MIIVSNACTEVCFGGPPTRVADTS